MRDTLAHAPNLHLLDTLPILYGGHAGSTTQCCARELLAMVITGKPDIEDHPCITAHQAVGVPLNDGPWRDDEHRTAVMRPLLKRLIRCSPRDDERDRRIAYKLADYAVRVCAVESLRAAGLNERANLIAALPPVTDELTAEAAEAAAAEAARAAAEAAAEAARAAAEAASAARAARAARAAWAAWAAAWAAAEAAWEATAERAEQIECHTITIFTIICEDYGA